MSKLWQKMKTYRRGKSLNNDDSDSDDIEYNSPEPYGYGAKKKQTSCVCTIIKWTVIILLVLLILAFFSIFVVIPIVFMESISIQRAVMFPNFDQPENPEYDNYAKYDAVGVRNMYITVNDILNKSQAVSLGVWQVVPEDRIKDSESPDFDYDKELRNSHKPICLYFHGNSGTRIFPYPTYQRLRKFFHVLAVDYRSYGDSTAALLTEEAVVNDLMQFYESVLRLTNQEEIYFWAHSLGTALSTHTLRKLTEKHLGSKTRLPKALMLEAPFTKMREEVPHHPIGKIFSWLPWFDATILDPLEDNGFHFWTTENIVTVQCPIMIIHAMDDSVIPYTLGEKLAHVARTQRDLETQGNVTLHIIPANARCDHMNINQYRGLEQFISDFLKYVKQWHENL